MKQGRATLLIVTGIFILSEIVFNYFVMIEGNADAVGVAFKTLFFLVLILLFSKRLVWAKWILSVTLILYGVLSFLVGFEFPVFFFMGAFSVFFGIFIHQSKALSVYREKDPASDQIEQLPQEQPGEMAAENKQHLYPLLLRRFQALFIDGMLILFVLVIIMIVVEDSEMRTPIMIASALLLSNYEPLLTAYSRTLGQRLMKIRVGKYDNPSTRINVLNAYVRWFVKGLLGWVSFITIHFNPQRRAIHDLASDSVMVKDEYFNGGIAEFH